MHVKRRDSCSLGVFALDALNDYILSAIVYKTNNKYYEILNLIRMYRKKIYDYRL